MIIYKIACVAALPITLMACSAVEDSTEVAEQTPTAVESPKVEVEPASVVAEARVTTPECASAAATAFSCRVEGGKQLSICLTGEPAIAEYRFGKPAVPAEMALSAGPGGSKPVISRAAYSGGGEAQARFANDTTGYVVFSRIVRTRFDGQGNEPEFSAGVMVERGGELQAEIKCAKPADADLDIGKLESVALSDDEAFFIPD